MESSRSVSAPAAPALPGSGTHVPALDAVRGLAILIVMAGHFIMDGGMARQKIAIDGIVENAAYAGWIGVDLFFVLSGFLITGILFDTKGRAGYFRNFYARRVLRIFPLYYGFLAAFFLVLPAVVSLGDRFAGLRADQAWYWTYLVNFQIAVWDWPKEPGLGHFWSLAVEEQFYLVWPFVVLRFDRTRLMRICVWTIAGAILFRVAVAAKLGPLAAYVLMPARMDALAIGALLALWIRGPAGVAGPTRWAWPATLLPGAALAVDFAWRDGLRELSPEMYTIGYTVLAVMFGGWLLLALRSPPRSPVGRVFGSRVLQFFGKYSYALYVFHPLVSMYLAKWWFPRVSIPAVLGSQIPRVAAYFLTATAISVALALASWHLWEKRFLALKRLVPYASRSAGAR